MTRIGEVAGTYCPGTFTIGRDFRAHGAQLENAFVSGLKKTSSDANLIGTCPASLCVFAN
jgi:phosphomannomutase